MKNDCIFLYKSGKFFNVFGDNGIIIHFLLGYKFVKYKNGVGFPESAIHKVTSRLEKEKISYEIYEKDNLLNSYKGIKQNYKKVLKNALKTLEIEDRLSRLKNKLDNFSLNDLEKVVEGIEDGTIE